MSIKSLQNGLAFILILYTSSIDAQLTIDAQIRPRTQYRHGFKSPMPKGEDPAFFTSQRTRLTTTYTTEKFKIKFAFQDVRIWGQTDQVYILLGKLNYWLEPLLVFSPTNTNTAR